MTMTILIGCFTKTFSSERVNLSGNGKGFTLEELFGSHSLSSDEVFLSIPLKTFSKFSGWTLKCFFAFNCSIVYFIYLWSKAAIELTELFSISRNGHNCF